VTFGGAAPAGGSIGNSGGGSSATRQFTTPGTYGYECTLHSGMTGTVVVQ
jgi:plastocyanin